MTMMLYVKDKYNVSNFAYQEMATICQSMPRHFVEAENCRA